jgi:hypothetical protein
MNSEIYALYKQVLEDESLSHRQRRTLLLIFP